MRPRPIPTKLGKRELQALMSPLLAGLAAFRMDRADTDHYHNLAGVMLIGQRAAELVPRHRHLIDEIKPSLDALNAVFERCSESPGGIFIGTPEEVDEIEIGVRIIEGIIRTTPGKVMLRAITRAQADAMECETV